MSSEDIKPGYKRTEVGVIPENWSLVAAGEIGRFRGGNGFPTKNQGGISGTHPFFKVSDMNNEGNETFMRTANNYISETTRKTLGANLFQENSIVFAKVGAAVFLERKKILTQKSCLDNNMAAYELDERKADYRFIHYRLLHTKFGDFVSVTALPSLSGAVLSKISFPLPSLPEQRTIATALSDVDALLAKIDQLIAKKRDLKQATMQQLLTGQTRLPGFSGEWEVKRLGDICTLEMGRTPSRANQSYWGQGYKWLSIADLKEKVILVSNEEVTELAAKEMKIIPKGTLLMSFKLSIGRLAFAGCDLFTNEAICSFNNLEANPNYLYYALSRIDFSLYGKQAVKGYTLNKASLKTVELSLPSPDEQTAIATVLSDMDAELATLQARRDKTHAIKQGMMQELLTGRIRLA